MQPLVPLRGGDWYCGVVGVSAGGAAVLVVVSHDLWGPRGGGGFQCWDGGGYAAMCAGVIFSGVHAASDVALTLFARQCLSLLVGPWLLLGYCK